MTSGPAQGDSSEDGLLRLEKIAAAMGTVFSIVLYGRDRAGMDLAVDEAFRELCRTERLLSNYLPSSEWSRINREAASLPVEVSAELFDLLAECLEYSRRSEGAFDITVGPLVDAWGFASGDGRLPEPAAVSAAKARVGYQNLRLDLGRRTVQFDIPGMRLNSGGVGKGYAVDRMSDVLRRAGFDRALVAGSSSSIYGLGAPPAEPRGWPTEIRYGSRVLTTAFLKDLALTTTGIAEKSFVAGGHVYSHIMDPHTGLPAPGMLLASVISPRAIDGEAWAKSSFINGKEWTRAHKPEGFRIFMCEDTPERKSSWV